MSPINNKEPEFTTTMFSEPKTRRGAIKSIASGMTVAALSGCVKIRKPKKTIKTYTHEEDLIAGIPNYYATSCQTNNDVSGLLVTSHEGRPTKIEGNPNHKSNNGTTSGFHQAEILNLYDPDRLKYHKLNNQKISTEGISDYLNSFLDRSGGGSNIAITLDRSYSIHTQQLVRQLKSNYSNINIFYLDHINNDNELMAIKDLTGTPGFLKFDYSKVKFILSFNHDFMGYESGTLASKRVFVDSKEKNESQFISFNDSLQMTCSKADEILTTSILEQEAIIKRLTVNILQRIKPTNYDLYIRSIGTIPAIKIDKEKINKITNALLKNKRKSIISVGNSHSKETHKLVNYLNSLLGNINNNVYMRQFNYAFPFSGNNETTSEGLSELAEKLKNKSVNKVISLGINLFKFDSQFIDLLKNTDVIYHTKYEDSFSEKATAVISDTHFLEHWDALLSNEGHLSIVQPLIEPLYNSISRNSVLLKLLRRSNSTYSYLMKTLNNLNVSVKELLSNGVIDNYYRKYNLKINNINFELSSIPASKYFLRLIPSYQLLDGRYSNNAWLQETPDSYSKLTWGNALYMNTDLAKEYKLKTGDIVKLKISNSKTLKAPIIILPGQNYSTLTIPVGYGTQRKGSFSSYGVSVDHISADISNSTFNIESIVKSDESVILADTQTNHGLDEESLAASGISQRINKILNVKTVEELHHHDDDHHHGAHHIHSLFKEQEYKGKYQWGMTIDLDKCLGCSACSIACQAENNIPIVGKEEVIKGREMSWIRIDRYFTQNNDSISINYQPVACVHCENAPCEQVCPVNATVHDDEGLNVMTYNRCVGTRYCANNCPYKVRRFNFFDWHQTNPQSQKKERIHLFDYFREPKKQQQMQFNPEVSIRMRGVMEKCSYCIQRLSFAKNQTKLNKDYKYVQNVKTACQQACATGCIDFGDLNDTDSTLNKKRKSKRAYGLLQTELNTKPRTLYLSKIINPFFNKKVKGYSNGHS